ncbi:MAG: hypothetical protein GX359_09595 [Clostridiales bacterium]|nr:hypothetical protein [Clostridiales bacterium]
MNNEDRKLSKYIDQLNLEKTPVEHRHPENNSEEYQQLMAIVREVRTLKEPEFPDEEYPKRLVANLQEGGYSKQSKVRGQKFKKLWIGTAAVVAAAAVMVFSWNALLFKDDTNIVYAMEQALEKVKAYHGILEIVERNELGEKMTQARREVWADKDGNYYVKELEGFLEGLITINNGKSKWQIHPDKEVAYLFETFPDPYRFTFELGEEIEDIKNALTVKEIGEEIISGRETILLEVIPDGGQAYHLWIDKDTDLPLQRQSAMQNSIQYKVKYTEIEFHEVIPESLLSYKLPEGYEAIDTRFEQTVSTIEEAEDIVGFSPIIPEVPEAYRLSWISVKIDTLAVKFSYNMTDSISNSISDSNANSQSQVVILQSKAENPFIVDSNAVLGKVGENKAEILTSQGAYSIRWQEAGYEYTVLGNITLEELSSFVKGLTGNEIILPNKENTFTPQIEVEVDLIVEENEQKSVDAGHSPWRLDPAFVTQVFASLLLSPEGIVGDYPIDYEDIQIIENNGIQAIAQIENENSIARKVYLERLIRQDESGIWTVIGYDLAE